MLECVYEVTLSPQVRVGEPTVHKFGLEELFYKYGVYEVTVSS